jgi:mycothiol synthase
LVRTPLVIRELDPRHLTPEEAHALNRYDNVIRAELWPEDAPVRPEVTLAHWRYVPWYEDHHQWVAWTPEGEAVGRGLVTVGKTQDNQHMADFDIDLVPSMRGLGLARLFLANIARVARQEGRSLLLCTTDNYLPAGKIFARRIGARRGLASQTNQLLLRETDWALVDEWARRGRARAGYELGIWEGAYPAEYLDTMIAMKQLINTAPTDNLEVEEFTWTRSDLREEERALENKGGKRWTIFIRHKASRDFAGFTEVLWAPHSPDGYEQGYTVVAANHRNRGFGQWLKAEMLLLLRRRTPPLRWVRTGNADANASMISINRRVGFRRYKSWTTWQIDLPQLERYLASHPGRIDTN